MPVSWEEKGGVLPPEGKMLSGQFPGGSWPASSPESSSPGHLGPSAGRTQSGPGSTLGLLLPSTPGGGRGSPPPRLLALGPPLHAAHGATLPPGPSLCLGELGQALAFAQGGGPRAAQVPAPQLAFSGASPSSSLYPLSVPPPPAVPCPGSWHESTRPSSLGQLLEKRDCYPILPTRAGSRRVPPGSAWAEDSPWRSGPWSPVPPRSPQGGISQAARAGPGLRKKGRPLASPGSVLGRRLSLRLMGDNVLLGPASCTGLHGAQLPDTLLSA